MKYLTFFITLPLTALCAYLILANENAASLNIVPGIDAYVTTLGIVAAAMLGIGFFFGALFVWLHAQKAVFRGWQERKRADRLEKELDLLQKKTDMSAADIKTAPRRLSALSFLQGK